MSCDRPSAGSTKKVDGCDISSRTCSGLPDSTPNPILRLPSQSIWRSSSASPLSALAPSPRLAAWPSRCEVPDEQAIVAVPAEWMDRLLGVLLDNACRHARSQVTIGLRMLAGRDAELVVSDDGEGVPATELSRLFERFHRGTTTGEGAGLGLAIADSVVTATHGRWEIASAPSQGAQFGVVWPLARGARLRPGSTRIEARTRRVRWRTSPAPAHGRDETDGHWPVTAAVRSRCRRGRGGSTSRSP